MGSVPPDDPKEIKTSSVCMCAPKLSHEGQKVSERLSAGLLAKGSERQLHKLPPREIGYMASEEKDVLRSHPSLSFYAR